MTISFKFIIAALIGGFIGASTAFYFARTDSTFHRELTGEHIMLKKEVQQIKSAMNLKREFNPPFIVNK